jgi:H/ACA ribonucleoprotein complex subunit 3
MKLKKCEVCAMYTFKQNCPKCGDKTKNPHPPAFSPQDKYGKYRRTELLKSKI